MLTTNSLEVVDAVEASPGHLDEGTHGVLGTEGVFNCTQQIIGLEYEDHLWVDVCQHCRNLPQELLSIGLDLTAL